MHNNNFTTCWLVVSKHNLLTTTVLHRTKCNPQPCAREDEALQKTKTHHLSVPHFTERKEDLNFPSILFKIVFSAHFSMPCPHYLKQGRSQGGGSWGARDPPLVGLLLSKQPTIFRWRKRHDNLLAVKAIVEKPTFLKFVFCKVFSSTALVFS